MEDHLSKGQANLKLSLVNFQRGQDIMISLMEEKSRKHCILSQYLMEQKHGKDPPVFGGNDDSNGSHHFKGPTGSVPSHSHVSSRATPRPYFPTFRNTQQRDYNPLNQDTMEDEWEIVERDYNNMSAGFRRKVSLVEFNHLRLKRKSKEHHRGDSELGHKISRM
jgi:hypothetical protein